MHKFTLALLAVLAGPGLVKAQQRGIRVVPLADVEASDHLNAALWQTQAACGSSLRYSINPAWNAQVQEQSWYATILAYPLSPCEADPLSWDQSTLVTVDDRAASIE